MKGKMNAPRRILALLLALCLTALFPALAEDHHSAFVAAISKHGNLELDISATNFLGLGYAFGDILSVSINGHSYAMPVCTNYTDVPSGMPVCRLKIDASSGADSVVLALNADSLARDAGIGQRVDTQTEPGFTWQLNEGVEMPLEIEIRMQQRGGYYNEWLLCQLVRSNERADYPDLTDAEFANFRPVEAPGIARGMLYRSSSPVNGEIGRSGYADAAARNAGVRCIVNLADSESELHAYEDYAGSHATKCNILCLNLGVDFSAPEFEAGLAEAFRFIIANDGPFLLHCNEGKDRAGFTAAVLECLAGADAQSVVADYMRSYTNYYGVEPGSERYEAIADMNIIASLEHAFGVDDLYAESENLPALARAYMIEQLGLRPDEVDALALKLAG